jgi:hypothetical protein
MKERNMMKKMNNVTAMGMVMSFGALVLQPAQAAHVMETSKGIRLNTGEHMSSYSRMDGENLSTVADFKNLRKGDRVASWCPMMQKTTVTTIRNVDTKGHVKMTETHQGLKMNGCNIILRRTAGTKEVESFMVCPDGTLTPIECRKM